MSSVASRSCCGLVVELGIERDHAALVSSSSLAQRLRLAPAVARARRSAVGASRRRSCQSCADHDDGGVVAAAAVVAHSSAAGDDRRVRAEQAGTGARAPSACDAVANA